MPNGAGLHACVVEACLHHPGRVTYFTPAQLETLHLPKAIKCALKRPTAHLKQTRSCEEVCALYMHRKSRSVEALRWPDLCGRALKELLISHIFRERRHGKQCQHKLSWHQHPDNALQASPGNG